MSSTNRFTVIKASAGSGKTFQLVLHYLSYALRFENEAYYKHILAITFTNSAAAEMKQRVLKALRELSVGTANADLTEQLTQKLGVDGAVIRKRAEKTYSHMLHNYGSLSILTIDSFTSRLVRSFARDLQLNNDFTIELNSEDLQEKAVDRMLEFIGQDELLTKYIHRFSTELLEEGKAWNPRQELINKAKVLFSEDGQKPLQQLADIDLPQIQEEYLLLIRKIKAHEERTRSLIAELLMQLTHAGVAAEDTPRKSTGYLNNLSKLVKNKKFTMPSATAITALKDRTWLNKEASTDLKMKVKTIEQPLELLADEIVLAFSEETMNTIRLMTTIKDNLYTLGLIDRMSEHAAEIRAEENMVVLSDFHRMINEIIRGNDAPFIFERIGVRYKHILVDEFQDTSKMQWMNLIPLIHNGLSQGHESMVVGDAKQSIYRWRSGYVEQFISLPSIPPEFEMPWAEKTFHDNIDLVPLQTNYRSSESVIEFNNLLFPALAEQLPSYNHVYDEVKQYTKKTEVGFVRLVGDVLLTNKDAGYDTFVQDETMKAIQECVASGISPGDITILVRSHSEGASCADWLKEAGYEFTTAESALLIHSATARIIMGFFEYWYYPQRHFAAFDTVQCIASIHPVVSLPKFIEDHISIRNQKHIDLIGFLSLNFEGLSDIMIGENVFHQAISLIRSLRLPFDSGTEYLLDLIKHHCIGKNIDLPRFIEWWKEHRHKLSAGSANHSNAIQIMTIHKSKGLEFPVVIFPHFAPKSKGSELWIEVPKDICNLPAAYIKVGANGEKHAAEETPEENLTPEITLERKRRFLDDINNLYVACTRAGMRMYFIQQKGQSMFNKLLDATLANTFPEYKQNGIAEIGLAESFVHEKKEANAIQTPSLQGREMLFPKLKLRSSIQRDTPEMEYGKTLHECLSLITHADTIDSTVRRVISGKNDFDQQHSRLVSDLQKIMQDKQAAMWFEENSTIYCEREFVSVAGKTLRPDRVIVNHDKVVVVDYKTGKQLARHADQVNAYKQELQSIYQKPVEGYLLYTEGPTIMAV